MVLEPAQTAHMLMITAAQYTVHGRLTALKHPEGVPSCCDSWCLLPCSERSAAA